MTVRASILVIEDDDDLRQIFRESLKLAGFDVRDTADGPDALRLIESTCPDVVVLDLGLPTLDGLSVLEEMASNKATRQIPIVVVTGSVVSQKRLRGARMLRKPVHPDQLVAAVRTALVGRW